MATSYSLSMIISSPLSSPNKCVCFTAILAFRILYQEGNVCRVLLWDWRLHKSIDTIARDLVSFFYSWVAWQYIEKVEYFIFVINCNFSIANWTSDVEKAVRFAWKRFVHLSRSLSSIQLFICHFLTPIYVAIDNKHSTILSFEYFMPLTIQTQDSHATWTIKDRITIGAL